MTNFATNSGSTSRFGMRLSDELARLLEQQLGKEKVIDRAKLLKFLSKERIPSKISAEANVACWLGKELGATIVLAGDIDLAPSVPQAMFVLLNVHTPNEPDFLGTDLPAEKITNEDIQPIELFTTLVKPRATKEGVVLYRLGAPGISSPICKHVENPAYTDEAREAKVQGSILMDAVVKTDGTIDEARILTGLPGGLNERALSIVQNWRCSPGMKDGKPVAVLITFETTFRLN